MYSIYANGENIGYGINKYIVDTEDDVLTLPRKVGVGSTAFVIDTSHTYMLNNEKIWVLVEMNNINSFWGNFNK